MVSPFGAPMAARPGDQNRRRFLKSGLAWAAGVVTAPFVSRGRVAIAAGGPEISVSAVDLVASSPVIDMLGLMTVNWPKYIRWCREPETFGLSEYRALESTGINIYHPAVNPNFRDPAMGAGWWLRAWNALLDTQPCYLQRIEESADLERADVGGKIGILFGFQNSDHFKRPNDVAEFRRRGQCVSQLTYNDRNRLGSGCLVKDRGLTSFGAEIVTEMNRHGMAIDVSHCGPRTTLEAAEVSTKPLLITHGNCRALVPGQLRNKTDAIIRRVAAGGGVMGITLVRSFVGRGSPSLEHVLDHFDHVARVAGVEHIGLGTDVALDAADPERGPARRHYDIRGLDLRARAFQIADGLLGRGWHARDVQQILGGNFLRALGEIWSNREGEGPLDPGSLRRDPFCPPPLPPDRIRP